MKQIIKFFIPLLFTLLICTIVSIYTVKTGDKSSYSTKNSEIKKSSPSLNKDDIRDSESKEVITKNSKAEKYVLKYNPKTDMVVLITKKQDGSEIISHINKINPKYLEKADIDALTKGIELSSKEDMFMLIEDYSS